MSKAPIKRPAQSKTMNRKWADPEWSKTQSARIRAGYRRKCATPMDFMNIPGEPTELEEFDAWGQE